MKTPLYLGLLLFSSLSVVLATPIPAERTENFTFPGPYDAASKDLRTSATQTQKRRDIVATLPPILLLLDEYYKSDKNNSSEGQVSKAMGLKCHGTDETNIYFAHPALPTIEFNVHLPWTLDYHKCLKKELSKAGFRIANASNRTCFWKKLDFVHYMALGTIDISARDKAGANLTEPEASRHVKEILDILKGSYPSTETNWWLLEIIGFSLIMGLFLVLGLFMLCPFGSRRSKPDRHSTRIRCCCATCNTTATASEAGVAAPPTIPVSLPTHSTAQSAIKSDELPSPPPAALEPTIPRRAPTQSSMRSKESLPPPYEPVDTRAPN